MTEEKKVIMAKKSLSLDDHRRFAALLRLLHVTVLGLKNDIAQKGGKVALADVCRALSDADESLFHARDKLDAALFKQYGRTADPETLRQLYIGPLDGAMAAQAVISFIFPQITKGDSRR